MPTRVHRSATCLLMLFLPVMASLALEVIYDSGRTRDIKKFYLVFRSPFPFVPRVYRGPMTISMSDRLPVLTPGLTPGLVRRRQHGVKGIARPVFLLGTDAGSRSWLTRNRLELQKHGVTGIIVNARTKAGVERVRRLAPELQIHVLPVRHIVKRLGIRHYPVLISPRYIEQ